MAEAVTNRVAVALELERIERFKAIEEVNAECDTEVSRITKEHAARGILRSGATGKRIREANIARARKIIEKAIELRRTTIQSVPELASGPHFVELLKDLEQIVDAVCRSIPEHIARHTGHTASLNLADEAMRLKVHARREIEILRRQIELATPQRPHQVEPARQVDGGEPEPDPRRVFVVHGRNEPARQAMFAFLRSINLDPIEWAEAVSLTREGSPFIAQILDKAFSKARAVVVLMTGDDLARLGTRFQRADEPTHEKELTPQARPNVLFEAGMAFGRKPERTILVALGLNRPFSDIAGRHVLTITNSVKDRQALADRLKTAGCAVVTENRVDWQDAGDFHAANLCPDEEKTDWSYSHPAPYSGPVYIRVMAPAHQNVSPVQFHIRWGQWQYTGEASFAGHNTVCLTHLKGNDGLSIPLFLHVSPACNVSFGQGSPPDENVVDINRGWTPYP